MPLLFYLILVNLLARVGMAVVRKRRRVKPEPMCATCTFAHMQYAVNGKRIISCTFGGGVRLVTLDVMYCTDYSNRHARPRVAIVGFVQPLPKPEIAAEAATAKCRVGNRGSSRAHFARLGMARPATEFKENNNGPT
jgi:hypothetical protein